MKSRILLGIIGFLVLSSTVNRGDDYTAGSIAVRLMIGLSCLYTAIVLDMKGDK